MVKAALGGDVSAAKLLLDRVLPAARTVKINLPKIERAQDAMDALSQLLESAAAGEVTATEAEGLSKLARGYLRNRRRAAAGGEACCGRSANGRTPMNLSALSRRLARIEAQLPFGTGLIRVKRGMRGLHEAMAQVEELRERRTAARARSQRTAIAYEAISRRGDRPSSDGWQTWHLRSSRPRQSRIPPRLHRRSGHAWKRQASVNVQLSLGSLAPPASDSPSTGFQTAQARTFCAYLLSFAH